MLQAAALGLVGVAAFTMFAGPRNTTRMTGSDGQDYDMQELPNKENALELLVEIKSNIHKLYEHYMSHHALANDPPVARFLARYKPDCFVENDMSSSDTSYSENKGQKIVVCLRDKTKPPEYPLIDKNTVMFVMLHEMAHLMTETIGHTPEFWNNFKRILHDSIKVGIYTSVNYAQKNTPYCGMTITNTPI